MRILLVHDYGVLCGGAETVTASLREGLRRRGIDARWLASRAQPGPLRFEADYSCYGTLGWPRCLLPLGNPSALLTMKRILRSFDPDLVHVRMFHTQMSPWILLLLKSRPALLHVVNYNLICPANTKTLPDGRRCHHREGLICAREGCVHPLVVVQNALVRRLTDLGCFARVVANSRALRRRLETEGVPVSDVVWNGVQAQPARPALGDPPTLGFSGRLVAKKGIETLLQAGGLLVDEFANLRILICGEGPDRRRLEMLCLSWGLDRHVTFLGHRERGEQERDLAGAWIQVVPSLWEEPFGVVAAEAMMRGTCVVASAGGGLGEQVLEGITGHLVPPGDPQALAECLRALLRDRARCEGLGAAGRERAMREFTQDVMVERFAAIYQAILGNGLT